MPSDLGSVPEPRDSPQTYMELLTQLRIAEDRADRAEKALAETRQHMSDREAYLEGRVCDLEDELSNLYGHHASAAQRFHAGHNPNFKHPNCPVCRTVS